jgi:hypothetical protein
MQIGRGGIGEPRGHCADAPPHPEPGDPDIDKLTAYIGYARTYTGRSGSLDLPSVMNQRTNTLGLRWDITRHIDAKVQLDHTVLHGGLDSSFINQQPGFNPTGNINVLSVAVDFTW